MREEPEDRSAAIGAPVGPPPAKSLRGTGAQIETNQPNRGDTNPNDQLSPSPPSRWGRLLAWLPSQQGSAVMMVVLTFVIAITGVVGIILIIRGGADTGALVTASRQQACSARSFAKSAGEIDANIGVAETDLARMAANSESAIKTTQEQMRLDQRAWVSLDHYELEPAGTNMPKGGLDQAFVVLKNTGKTPAVNVHVVRGAYYKKNGSPSKADGRWMDLIIEMVEKGRVGPNGMLIAPKTRHPDKWGHDWDYEMLKDIALFDDRLAPPGVVEVTPLVIAPRRGFTGLIAPQADPLKVPVGLPTSPSEGPIVVVYGTVFYEDVFGNHHETDFCGIEHGGVPISSFNTYVVRGDRKDFTDCAVHNAVDIDYEKQKKASKPN